MRIIGPESANHATVVTNIRKTPATPVFLDEMLPALWQAGLRYYVDPVGVVAQSYKETGGGSFRGQINARFYNPCGLKVRHTDMVPGVTTGDEPLAHQMFPNWTVGTDAHVQHLRAYTGWPIEPGVFINDPRYYLVVGKHCIENWSQLGGKWAPSPTYGQEIEDLMVRLAA
jgi:N-acetylmuramoyl-L-alanine amidase